MNNRTSKGYRDQTSENDDYPYKKPDFFFRALIVFIIIALIVVNIVLAYSKNKLDLRLDDLEKKNKELQLQVEELQERYEADMTDEENIRKEAERKGYRDPNSKVYGNDIPANKK